MVKLSIGFLATGTHFHYFFPPAASLGERRRGSESEPEAFIRLGFGFLYSGSSPRAGIMRTASRSPGLSVSSGQ